MSQSVAPISRSSTPISDALSSSTASSRSLTPVEGSSSKMSRSSSADSLGESSLKPAPRHKDLSKFLGVDVRAEQHKMGIIEEGEEEAPASGEETPLLSESDSRSSTLDLD